MINCIDCDVLIDPNGQYYTDMSQVGAIYCTDCVIEWLLNKDNPYEFGDIPPQLESNLPAITFKERVIYEAIQMLYDYEKEVSE
jgi:hypothetical protein